MSLYSDLEEDRRLWEWTNNEPGATTQSIKGATERGENKLLPLWPPGHIHVWALLKAQG